MFKKMFFYFSFLFILFGCSSSLQNPMLSRNESFAFVSKFCEFNRDSVAPESIGSFYKESKNPYANKNFYWCMGVWQLSENDILKLQSISFPKNSDTNCNFYSLDGAFKLKNRVMFFGYDSNKILHICEKHGDKWNGHLLVGVDLNTYTHFAPKDYRKRENHGYLKIYSNDEIRKIRERYIY